MNFDEFDNIIDGLADLGLTESQRSTAEFALAQTVQFGQQYKDASYMIPFAYINFQLLADTLLAVKHPAFTREKAAKFVPDDFPELEYGADENQPALSQVFADFLNVMFASTVHEKIGVLQSENLVEVTFEGDKLQYALTDDALEDKYGSIIEFANVFL